MTRCSAWARWLIRLYILGCLLIFFGGLAALTGEMTYGYANPLITFGIIANPLTSALFTIAAIPVVAWVYYAHANLHEMGLRDLSYSPGWAAASFFIPFANLAVPFRAMRELYNRSEGEDAWQAEQSVGDVTSWWSCLIAAIFLQILLGTLLLIDGYTSAIIHTPPGANSGLALFSVFLLAGSGFYLQRNIVRITRAQQSHTAISQAFA